MRTTNYFDFDVLFVFIVKLSFLKLNKSFVYLRFPIFSVWSIWNLYFLLNEAFFFSFSTKACRLFDQGNGNCPFGTSCFYKHGKCVEVLNIYLLPEHTWQVFRASYWYLLFPCLKTSSLTEDLRWVVILGVGSLAYPPNTHIYFSGFNLMLTISHLGQ